VLLSVAALGASCGGGGGGREGVVGSSEGGAGETAARDVRPQRIISLTPSTTEILSGVGAFDRVVAVSDYCTYPPEVKDLPRIGGWQNTNLERVASFRPDLIVMTQAQEPFIKERVEALGARTLVVRDRTLDDALNAVAEIGRATGNVAEAEVLLARTRSTLEEIRARTRELPRRRVLCIVDRLPGTLRGMYSANEGSFLAQLIEIAGGESIVPRGGIGFGQIQKEAVLELDPEVIIDLMMHKTEGRFDEDIRVVYSELSNLRAVREGRVYSVREETVLHPSQFVGDTARRFAALIHPEVFKQ
jgi:iron complex transport system substrate-binding protein